MNHTPACGQREGPAIRLLRLLVVKPETAWTMTQSAPARGHDAWIAEAQGSGSLALPYVGLVDALEERRADGTALAGTFNHKQTVVDLAGLVHQLGQVLEAGADAKVPWLVDDGLDTKVKGASSGSGV